MKNGKIPNPVQRSVELKMFYGTALIHHKVYSELMALMGSLVETEQKLRGLSDDTTEEVAKDLGFTTSTVRRLILVADNIAFEQVYQKGGIATRVFASFKHKAKARLLGPDDMRRAYHRLTRPAAYLPRYEERIEDLAYQCCLSVKKSYMLGRIGKWALEEGHKIVIFAQYSHSQFELELLCSTLGVTYVAIKADQTQAQREKMLEMFQDPNRPSKVLVTSFRIAATSLNMHTATKLNQIPYQSPAKSIPQPHEAG